MTQTVKNLPAVQETWVWSLGWEDPPEKEMAVHSSILAWRIPRTEESGGLQSRGRRESDTTEWLNTFTSTLWPSLQTKKGCDGGFIMCLQTSDPEADRNVTASLTLGQGKSAPHSSYRTVSDGFGHCWNLPVLVFLESSFSRESVWVLSWPRAQERGLACSLARAHSPRPGTPVRLTRDPLSAFRLEPCNIVQNAQEQWVVISSV